MTCLATALLTATSMGMGWIAGLITCCGDPASWAPAQLAVMYRITVHGACLVGTLHGTPYVADQAQT